MNEPVKEITEIIKPAMLALAFAGSLVAESFWPAISKPRSVVNILTGTAISAASVPAIIELVRVYAPEIPTGQAVQGALHFWAGLFGMQIVPIVSTYIQKVKAKLVKENG